MKKLLSYTTILVLCVGCFDNDFVTKPVFIDDTYMGRESTSTKIVSISSRITTGKIDAELNVTPGAMYSLQLVNIKGEMVKNHGFTAEEVRVVKSLDYREVPNGSYDLTLMDTQGNITKVPLIIQR